MNAARQRLIAGVSRREFLVGGMALATLAACGSDSSGNPAGSGATTSAAAGITTPEATAASATTASPSEVSASAPEGWTFIDDRGVTVELSKPPERIVAYVGTAAMLWDFGVRPIGVFGPLLDSDGKVQVIAGRIDPDAVESLGGDGSTGVNIEALAAMKPDLIVSHDVDFPWMISEHMDEIAVIAPIVVIDGYKARADTIVGNYERFAVATGIDPESAELVAAKADYASARDALEDAIATKPELTVMVVTPLDTGLRVSNPPNFPDLLEFKELGLDLVEPGGPTEWWIDLSWETADTYPADVILVDVRVPSKFRDSLASDQPIWATLPAVAAGQIGSWSAEAILSYQGLRDVYRELTQTIEKSRDDVV